MSSRTVVVLPDPVAAAAGVAKGTPYLYFASKEDLLSALCDRYLKDWYSELERLLAIPEPGTDRRRLEEFLRAMYQFHSDKVELHHLLLAGEGAEDQVIDSSRKLLLEFMGSGARNRIFQVTSLEATVEFILHGLHGLLVSYLHQGRSGETFTADSMSVLAPILSGDAPE